MGKTTGSGLMTNHKRIMLTGGGSAGHVSVNLALIPLLRKEGWAIQYIGSEQGIEKELIAEVPDVKYWSIATGKLRRYIDLQNIKDPFKVIKGVFQAYRIIKKEKPHVVFSKGGFVSVPVVLGAWMNKVPVLIHESDMTPGLANRIAIPFSTGVCATFPETMSALPRGKSRHIGPVVREELFHGNAKLGRDLCGFRPGKPVLLVMGGSLGAKRINAAVREALPELLERFQVVHLCGKDGEDASIAVQGYKQFAYVNEQLPDLLAMADIALSRAGSNAIFELAGLQKPMLLIPLPKGASRGDQLLNAQSFERSGFADVLYEEQLAKQTLLDAVFRLYDNRERYAERMAQSSGREGLNAVYGWLQEAKAGKAKRHIK